MKARRQVPKCQPILILGKSGTLGTAFSRTCTERNIHHILLSRADVDITDRETVEQVIQELNPWAIINAAGYARVDEAEKSPETCIHSNSKGASVLAEVCQKYPIKLLAFSTDFVFDGAKNSAYVESDKVNPLNVYGKSKAMAEENILSTNPKALVIRTSSFFGPWDSSNFVTTTLADLKEGRKVSAANDVYVSPTYVPDLVNESLDLLLDNEHGIFHLTNYGKITWADFAMKVAEMAGCDTTLIDAKPLSRMQLKQKGPTTVYCKVKKE
jgi:dTDP-4-dehydrorhamnose reductase